MRALVACALMVPLVGFDLVMPECAGAQRHRARPLVAHAAAPGGLRSGAAAPGELHLTHVSLYKNGVGFFERAGQVRGDAEVSLPLSTAQLNDVLASLTAVDLGGGHLSGANYNSTTPLGQQLRDLPLSLGPAPTEGELFTVLRGARVEVSGEGGTFAGRLLSTEVRPVAAGRSEGSGPAPLRRVLTLVAENGATRTMELGPRVTVRVLEDGLRADLNTYLALLDGSRTEGTRRLVLWDRGAGEREVRVSYLSEVPVWKSTYRVLLSTGEVPKAAGQTATVQGFSVVDNTTGEDWNGVQLSLIAGSPQSFLQPISQPVYDRRVEVPVAENAQVVPQTHSSGEGVVAAARPMGSASADLGSGAGGNPASLFGSATGTGMLVQSAIPKEMVMMKDTGAPPLPEMAPHAAAAPLPEQYEQMARDALNAYTRTAAWDDFFSYDLPDPVTIPRNGSALVPILQEELPVEDVTVVPAGQRQPLRALWLTNNSRVTLDAGSFAVVENGAFAGQGLTEPVHAGERRLLSYAVDQAVRVSNGDGSEVHRLVALKVTDGVLVATTSEMATEDYEVRDAAPQSRVVLLEVPRRMDWTLYSETRPEETTPEVYRFRLPVPAHGKTQLLVTQQRLVDQRFALLSSTEEQLRVYVLQNGGSTALLAQLEPVFAAQRNVAALQAQVHEVGGRIAALEADQKRLRENLAVLKGSPQERALVRRYTGELEAQEDTLASLLRQLAQLQEQQGEAGHVLQQRIAASRVEAG